MPPTKLPDLAPAQEPEAKDLFVISLLEIPEIAARLGVSRGSVRKASTRGNWIVERRRYGSQEAVLAARKAHADKMAEARTKVELGCAELALERIAAQLKVARELHRLASEPTPNVLTTKEDGQGLASALGPASQDVTSGRLAVGLSTDKVDVDDARADEFRRNFFNLLSAECAVAPAGSSPGDAPSVEQGNQASPERVADKA